jgi:hypothetical protein
MAQNMLPPGDPTAPDFDYSDLPNNFDCDVSSVTQFGSAAEECATN